VNIAILGHITDTDMITFPALMLQSSFDDVLGGTDITKRAAISFGLPSYWLTNSPLQSNTISAPPSTTHSEL
jgi:hypothetical protein